MSEKLRFLKGVYTDFYNLKEKPFNLTPSPLFLYLGESHKEALALLTYGIEERKGFILLTGEIGTGKTTIVQALLANLDESVEYIHIANPRLSSKEFFEYITFSVFKKKVPFESRATFLFEFEAFLKDCIQHQKTFVLIIDEAQTLSFELLEELRLLSNIESTDEKLINIILVGQPELNEKLRDPICKALLQRISHRFHILPFNLEDTRRYIERRLDVAGIKDANEIFSKGAIKAIYGYSQGYPRVINILADNCLLLGYSKGKRKITSSTVDKSFEDMQLDFLPPKIVEESPNSEKGYALHEKKSLARLWKWAAVLLLMLIIVAFGVSQKGRKLVDQMADLIEGSVTKLDGIPQNQNWRIEKKDKKGNDIDRRNKYEASSFLKKKIKKDAKVAMGEEKEKRFKWREEKSRKDQAINNLEKTTEVAGKDESKIQLEMKDETVIVPVQSKEIKNLKTQRDKAEKLILLRPLIVKDGDTLAKLSYRFYGDFNDKTINLIQKYNPELTNINRIIVGQKLIIPSSIVTFPMQSKGPFFTIQIASSKSFKKAKEQLLRMTDEGYESYIIATNKAPNENVFRVTLGNFRTHKEAKDYSDTIIKNRISNYAVVINFEKKDERLTTMNLIGVSLEWDANTEPDLAGYKVYYKIGSSGEPYDGTGATEGNSPVDIGNVTTYKLHGLAEDVTYFFVVTAYDTEGLESEYSNEVTIN
jgi:type II secretory pathway predicted ATPase ExeA